MSGSEVVMKLLSEMVQFKVFTRYRDIKQERKKLELKMK